MDELVIKKDNIAFGVLLLIIISAIYIWLSSIYFLDYINRKDIIKIHFSQLFILFAPLLLYFSFIGIMVLLNKEKVLRKYKLFRVLVYFFLALAFFLLSF